MESTGNATDLKRYVAHVFVATSAVTALPLLAARLVERSFAVTSSWVTISLGVVLSILAAMAGSAAWRKFGRNDIVFSDLLVWGYLRRLWIERRLNQMTRQLAAQTDATSATREKPQDQAKLLSDLASLMESSDPYTQGHSRRVTRHSYMIAKTMGLPKHLVEKVRIAAAVHDVGKIHTPKNVLHKAGRLTDEEFAVIKEHPSRGADMVEILEDPDIVAMVRHHHERLDGRGYPSGLRGEDIPLGARIISVADTFDAITSTRPYRSAARHIKAIDILKKEAGKQLDETVVNAFLRYYSGRSSIGWWASLTTVPQRLLGAIINWFQQTAAGAAVQTAAAIGTSVALVASAPAFVNMPAAQAHPAETGVTAKADSLQEGVASDSGPDRDTNPTSDPAPGGTDPSPEPTRSPAPEPSSTTTSEADPSPDPTETARTSPSPSPTPTASPTPSPTTTSSPIPLPSPTSTDTLIDVVEDVVDILL